MPIKNAGANNQIDIPDHLLDQVDIRIEGSHNTVTISPGSNLHGLIINVSGFGHIVDLDDVTIISGLYINMTTNETTCRIGKGTTIESGSIALAEKENFVYIGQDCMFAMDTHIIASDFHSILDAESHERINCARGVKIGNHVWIGIGCKILKNTTVGDGVVIGAGSIVSGTIPLAVIAVGAPPKIVRENICWERRLVPATIISSSVEQKQKHVIFNAEQLKYHIESVEHKFGEKEDVCIISGWAFLKDVKSQFSTLLVTVDAGSQQYNFLADLVARKDVTDFFGKMEYLFSGFYVVIPEKLLSQSNEINLLIQNTDYSCATPLTI